MFPNLNDLPRELLIHLYQHADYESLIEISRSSTQHRDLAFFVLRERFKDKLLSHYNNLSVEIKTKVSVKKLTRFLSKPPKNDLVTFMKEQSLTIDQMNVLAQTCFAIMWSAENPGKQTPRVPQISQTMLEKTANNEVEELKCRAVAILMAGFMSSTLTIVMSDFLERADTEKDVVFIFLLSSIPAVLHLIYFIGNFREENELRVHVRNVPQDSHAQTVYKYWLEFLLKETTTSEHELIQLEGGEKRDKMQMYPYLASLIWIPYYLYCMKGPMGLIMNIVSAALSMLLSKEMTEAFCEHPYRVGDMSIIDVDYIINGMMLYTLFMSYHVALIPEKTSAREVMRYEFEMATIQLLFCINYNLLKYLIIKGVEVAQQIPEMLSTARTWLPSMNRGYQRINSNDDQRHIIQMEEGRLSMRAEANVI